MKNGRSESYVYEELGPGGKRTVTLATNGGALRVSFRRDGEGEVAFQVEQVESHGEGVACEVATGVIGEVTV